MWRISSTQRGSLRLCGTSLSSRHPAACIIYGITVPSYETFKFFLMEKEQINIPRLVTWVTFLAACALLSLLAFFLLKDVPFKKSILALLGGTLPPATSLVINVSDFVKAHLPVVFLTAVIVSFGWIAFIFTAKNTLLTASTNTALAFLLFGCSLFVYFGMKLPLFSINTTAGERAHPFQVLFGEPVVSYSDFTETVDKEKNLKLSIETVRQQYAQGEDVVIMYMFKNTSRKPQLINDIVVPGGNLTCWLFSRKDYVTIRKPEPVDMPPIWIEPFKKNLTWLAPEEYLQGEISFSSQTLAPGEYEARASLIMHGTLKKNILSNIEYAILYAILIFSIFNPYFGKSFVSSNFTSKSEK